MRIQHNIPAMNAYRNYNGNTKALQSNLQKLSSGYKINKAGDDAAGLAISEKMRAQITGLEVAQKNAKDGISLVQTAEGATTEIHTMLNRMFALAEQSANGTYDDEVDRAQLDNEFTKLKDEIDRIADATNFNGKKLLDGSLDGGKSGGASGGGAVSTSLSTIATAIEATKGKYTMNVALAATGSNLDTKAAKMSFTFSDGNGNDKVVEFEFKSGDSKNGTANDNKGIYANGKWVADVNTTKTIGDTEWGDVLKGAFKEFAPELNENFNITWDSTAKKMTFEAKEAGAGTMQFVSYTQVKEDGTLTATSVKVDKEAADGFEAVDVNSITAWDGEEDTLEDAIFEVNGHKMVMVDSAKTLNDAQKKLLTDAGVGKNYDTFAAATGSQNNTDAQKVADLINSVTGISASIGNIKTDGTWEVDATTATNNKMIGIKPQSAENGGGAGSGKGGLRLRVGDSTNSYDDITVSVKSMKADKLADLTEGTGKKLKDLSVDKPENADTAMKALKGMINYVSNERGKLGATQNRLDHTINNLSTMQENIQDAEATIRDVDVAEEMMKYTKNNILVQSAQAMLAQANQLPQGVLQLLG